MGRTFHLVHFRNSFLLYRIAPAFLLGQWTWSWDISWHWPSCFWYCRTYCHFSKSIFILIFMLSSLADAVVSNLNFLWFLLFLWLQIVLYIELYVSTSSFPQLVRDRCDPWYLFLCFSLKFRACKIWNRLIFLIPWIISFVRKSYVVTQGCCIEYIILEGDNLASLFPNAYLNLGVIELNPRTLFAVIATLAVLPTVWLRDLSILSYISGNTYFAQIIT